VRALEQALRRFGDGDRILAEVVDRDGQVERRFTYREITRAARALTDQLPTGGDDRPLRVGVVTGNSPAFVVADLALISARVVEVPVPLAFSVEQAAGLLDDVDVCLVDGAGRRGLDRWRPDRVLRPGCAIYEVDIDALLTARTRPYEVREVPGDWICKVIHTSGTTSRPKGVRIRAYGLDALLRSLRDVMPAGAFGRYLSLVPFSLLIEQVTGLYMPILHGGSVTLLPEEMALVGTSAAAAGDVLPLLARARPTAMVATPSVVEEMATAATAAKAADASVVQTLFGRDVVPLVCCGGAPVHPDVLTALDAAGVPVYEGYGLSENSSVVSWNRPDARRIGTVGVPLPHVEIKVADDGELLVRSTSLFAGYTRDDPSSCAVDAEGWLHTGDLAAVDADDFVRITGRKKNVIITAAGRNIAPEWVEAQYATLDAVDAVAVVGNGLTALHALFLIPAAVTPAAARSAIEEFGRNRLSDVERVAVAHVVPARDAVYRRFFTVTGRPRREALRQAIRDDDPILRGHTP
jgi:long-subunit acyl-CoA synthetase (AMP-forming)